MDVRRAVTNAMQADPGTFLFETAEGMSSSRFGRVICSAAEILTPTCEDGFDIKARQAIFSQGAALAVRGFLESDSPEALRTATLERFSLGLLPIHLVSDRAAIAQMDQLYASVPDSREEFRDASIAGMNYFLEVTQNTDYSSAFLYGIGFSIKQLEVAWAQERENAIEALLARELEGVDWDNVFGA